MNLKYAVKEHNVINIIGYLRKSRQDLEREKRTGEDTLAEQTELMNRVLNSIELPYDLKMEIGSGESIDGRPVFQEVLKELEQKKYQAIAVKELSRLSRGNYTDAGKIIQIITDNRLVIITPYKVYDPRNTMDMKQIRFELFLAREEYEMIKERMVGARYIYASQGKWVAGKSPYGYDYNKRTQKLTINEEEARTVRLIYDLFLNGLNGEEISYQGIATRLTKLGIPTARGKKTWAYSQIKNLLESELYIGTIKFRTTETVKKTRKAARPESEHIYVEDAHEPIIDKEIWYKVQDKIKNKVHQHHSPLDFDPCELASVCVCSVCGGKLVRSAGKRKYKKRNGETSEYVQEFLKCQKNYCMNVKYRDVEDAILYYMETLEDLNNDILQTHLNGVIKRNNNCEGKTTKEQLLKQIEQKEKELAQRLEFIYEKYEQGIYTDEMFLQRKQVIDDESEELQKQKDELSGESKSDKLSDEQIIAFKNNISNLVDAYREANNKKRKNELLREIFYSVKVTITKKGHGRKSAEFDIAPKLNDATIPNP